MSNAETVKQQIRRRMFQRDFARGEAATSRFAAFFAICTLCRGRGTICQHYPNSVELCECDRCTGAGFIEQTTEEDEQ